MEYAIRVNRLDDEDADQLALLWLRENCQLVVFEAEDDAVNRDHYHAIAITEVKEQALRARFKRACPRHRGNGAYSIKLVKPQGEHRTLADAIQANRRYVCKGVGLGHDPQVVHARGLVFTPENIDAYHRAYWENQAAFRPRRQTMVDTVFNEANASNIQHLEGIARLVRNEIVRRRVPFNIGQARGIVTTVGLMIGVPGLAARIDNDLFL